MMKLLKAFLIGGIGGWIFSIINTPIPWTLGPLISTVIAKMWLKTDIFWPVRIRNTGMVILGYIMGRTFTPETAKEIIALLPILFLVTIGNIVLCLLGGLVTWRFCGLSLSTSVFGSLPAGLHQMASICEEIEGADIGAITLMQTIRVFTVVIVVPFISFHALSDQVEIVSNTTNFLTIHDLKILFLYFTIIAILILIITKFFKTSGTLYVILPLIITAIILLFGVSAPELPATIVNIAQIFVSIRIGSTININTLSNWKRISALSFLSVIGILIATLLIDYHLTQVAQMSFLTAFISTAPGGMAEMGLTAMAVHADLPKVIAFQFFRLLFVLLLVVPASSWIVKRFKVGMIRLKGGSG